MGSGALEYRNKTVAFNSAVGQRHPPTPYIFDDFLTATIALDPWCKFAQSGTATTAFEISASAGVPVAGHGGWAAGSVDNVDAEIDEIAIGPAAAATAWRADQVGTGVLVCEWAINIPTALTARQYFAGLSDDPTEATATNGALNIQTGYTLVDTADDAAGFILSSLATVPTWWKIASTDSGTGSTMAAANDAFLAVAATWTGLRVEVDVAGDTYFSSRSKRGGSLVQYGKTNVGLSPDVLLVPLFTAAATTTTAVPYEIDYCFVSADHAV